MESVDLDRQRAGFDAFVALVDVDRRHLAIGFGLVRHLGLHQLEDEQGVPGLDRIARLDQDLPHIAGNLGVHLMGHRFALLFDTVGARQAVELAFEVLRLFDRDLLEPVDIAGL